MSADQGRRRWLRAGALLPLVPLGARAAAPSLDPAATLAQLAASVPRAPAGVTPAALASDRRYWSDVAALYDVTDRVVQLENGYWGAMARPVLQNYQALTATVNRDSSWYARRDYPAEFEAARAGAAGALGVEVDEIVLTRGATEALQALIGGYNRLAPGDVVLCADIDYDAMIAAMRWLKQRRGVEVVSINLPEPFSHDSVIDCYAKAMARHPRLKLLLITQVNHRNGMQLPVADISRMARQRGIDVIVDAAHGVGQLDMRIADLQADFVGINLHKWIGAPVGVGAVYIKRGRVRDIDPYMGEQDGDDVRTRVHTGTANFAAFLALPLAFEVHQRIGVANKQARLQGLRNRWVEPAREIAGIEVLASADPRLSSAIAAFRLKGQATLAQNVALAKRLVAEHGVFTIHRDGLASGACVRVTPSLFTTEAQVDRLLAALHKVAKQG
ncbi:aminotransferase class V-fold PLP-dependent enzyme [Rugamonas sp. CCM 8940]|uniref:aminotransferase class V-fold PLP-dependent enzyme n=1 Tax=Rugamonas sp. CCM 8940 TaxID=2765359 RepID=UPI00351C05BF